MIIKPFSAQFELTERCSHRCAHCYNSFSHFAGSSVSSLEVVDAISKSDLFDITITGGEPLLERLVLRYSIERFSEENMDVSINSNLYPLNFSDADFFSKNKVRSVLSSILGPNESFHDSLTGVRGSFSKLILSLNLLKEKDIPFSANMVITKDNVSQVYNTGILLSKLGARVFAATPAVLGGLNNLFDKVLSREEVVSMLNDLLRVRAETGILVDTLHPLLPCMFDLNERGRYLEFYSNRYCVASSGTIAFSPNGNVRVCSHDRRIYGSILSESLEDILPRMNKWKSEDFIPEKCGRCLFVKTCRGGCRVSAECFGGSMNSPDIYASGPITENNFNDNLKMDLELTKLNVRPGNIRYRDEQSGLKSIYIDSRANGTFDENTFNIFRMFMAGKNYSEIAYSLDSPEFVASATRLLASRGLLV
jgi:radical SAM protein with 4Fe4S-binding SPASM domain